MFYNYSVLVFIVNNFYNAYVKYNVDFICIIVKQIFIICNNYSVHKNISLTKYVLGITLLIFSNFTKTCFFKFKLIFNLNKCSICLDKVSK